ncbi:17380_t:CDS:2 [Entrophospora sp. SA101]|nr:17380_t:CDS:2 [Entrophospora sp. SA101]
MNNCRSLLFLFFNKKPYCNSINRNSRSNIQLKHIFLNYNQKRFAGHNKWSKVKHIKVAKDGERSMLFARISKEIQLSVKEGGTSDPSLNVRLAAALAQAKKVGLPKDTMENAIKRGLGQGKDQNNIESLKYEAYGPGGVAYIIEALTDNKNRTSKEIKSHFNKAGGSMSSVSWMFDKKGSIQFHSGNNKEKDTIDKMMDNVIEIEGIEDIKEVNEDTLEITCEPLNVNKITKEIKEKYDYEVISIRNSGYIPKTKVSVNEELMEVINKLEDGLNEVEDVVRIYNNFE